jgi:hypothetical protein
MQIAWATMRKLGTEKHDQPASQPAAVFLHIAHLNGSIYFFYSLVDFCWIIRDFTLPGYSRVHIPSTARWLRSTVLPSNAQKPWELGDPAAEWTKRSISPRVISLGKSVQLVSSDPPLVPSAETFTSLLLLGAVCRSSREYRRYILWCCYNISKRHATQRVHFTPIGSGNAFITNDSRLL